MPKGDKELLNEIKGLKQRYRAFVDDAPDGIIEVGRNGVVLYANRKALKIAGRAKGNFIGKSLASLMPSESVFRELRDLQKVFRGKTLEDYSFEIADKKGKIRGVVANINPVKDGTKITGAQIILRCAPALGTAEAKCAGLLENANDLIQSVNSEGKFIYVNKKWKELLGYSDAEVKKLGLMDIIRKDQRAHCKEMFGKVMRGKTLTAVETVFVGKRGNEVHVEGNVTPHMENGKFVSTMAIFRDVSGRKTAEAGLKESEIKFREIFELSPEAIVAISPNGKIIEVNKRIYDWLGYKPNDIKGMHMLKLPFIPAKSKAIMIKNFGRRMLGKDFPPYELEFKAKGGKIIVGRIIGTLIKDSKGKKIADLIMISDVTEQAKYEDALRQSKHDLEVAMRRLGKTNKELMHQSNMRQEFINTVVHELKTPLTPVRGYLEMLLGEDLGELNPKQKDALEVISRSINLSKNLIEDLSGLSKAEAVKSKVTKKRTDLLDIINFVAKEMKSFALEKKITLVAELPKSLPVVNADRGQMEQLLTNLIHNAIKFTPEQGFVGVSAARQGKNIVVSIRDTGIGISKADQKKLFTKFFRAKSARDEGEGGTGLGLSICKRIIEVHNGKIGVKSTLGRGTTFTFTIPAMG